MRGEGRRLMVCTRCTLAVSVVGYSKGCGGRVEGGCWGRGRGNWCVSSCWRSLGLDWSITCSTQHSDTFLALNTVLLVLTLARRSRLVSLALIDGAVPQLRKAPGRTVLVRSSRRPRPLPPPPPYYSSRRAAHRGGVCAGARKTARELAGLRPRIPLFDYVGSSVATVCLLL